MLGWEGFSFVALMGFALALLGLNAFAVAELLFFLCALVLIVRMWTAVRPVSNRFRGSLRSVGFLVIVVLFWRTILWVEHRRLVVETANKSTQTVPAPPLPTPIYIGCSMDHIPFHITRGSTIHVIRLIPGITKILNPNMATGVIEDVSATDKDRDWPSREQGTWMTDSEIDAVLKQDPGIGIPTPFAFKCTASSGKPVDDVSVDMVVKTSDNKKHSILVALDPLSPTNEFSFYVVNICPVSIFADLEGAIARSIDESIPQIVPVKIIKRNWPADLMVFQPTAFHWNDRPLCDWNTAN